MKKRKNKSSDKDLKIVLFCDGELIKATRDKFGFAVGDNGHTYEFGKDERWHCIDASPKVKSFHLSMVGRIVSKADGLYQYQDKDGSIQLVCIQRTPPAFVSLSLDNVQRYGRFTASRFRG